MRSANQHLHLTIQDRCGSFMEISYRLWRRMVEALGQHTWASSQSARSGELFDTRIQRGSKNWAGLQAGGGGKVAK